MKWEGRGGGERDEGVGDDEACLVGADDVGIAAGREVARDDGAGGIDEDAFGFGAAAVDANFVGHRREVPTKHTKHTKAPLARTVVVTGGFSFVSLVCFVGRFLTTDDTPDGLL